MRFIVGAIVVLFLSSSLFGEQEKEKGKKDMPPGPYVLKEPIAKKSKRRPSRGPNSELLYLKGRKSALDGKYRQAVAYLEQALKGGAKSALILNQLSESYLKLGEGERAIELGRKAAELEPKNASYQMSLASTYAAVKRYSEAKEYYQKALKLNPNDRKIPLLLGIIEAELGEFDASIKVFSKYIKSHPESENGYFYRARIYLEKDDLKRAKKDLATALSLRPSFLEAGLTLGMLHERLGEIDEAIEVYKQIDGSGRYKKRLAQLYLQKKMYKEALQNLLEYERLEPDDFSAKVKVGLIYFELKDHENAAKRFRSILKEEPKSDSVRFYLGAVLEEAKKNNEAIKEYKRVSPESSFFSQSVLHVGYLLKEANKIREGIRFSKGIVARHPEIPEFFDMYAAFYEHKKNFKTALRIVQKGLRKHAKNEKLLYFEGAMYDKIGKREEGIANMKMILEINGNNPHALNFLGYTYAEMGKNLVEAEKLVARALKIRPNDGFIEDSLGWVLFKQGKVDEALKRLKKASALQPEEAVIYDHLGDVYAKKKDFKSAITMYEKAAKFSQGKDTDLRKKVKNKLAKLESKENRVPSNKK